ncbi:MAG: cyclase family protein [Acholeplasmataceae bacterium]
MKIYDVTMKIDKDIQVYKNISSKKPQFKVIADHDKNDYYETDILMNSHTGTHLDFQLHMVKDGKDSSTLDFKKFIRKVKVFDLTNVNEEITLKDVKDLDIKQNDFILFKTKNSFTDTFDFKFVYIRKDAAEYLASRKIAGVGVDGLGIERDQKGHPTHLLLMAQDIDIIEGLRLKDIKEDTYFMYAQAIPFQGLDACPMSVILVKND